MSIALPIALLAYAGVALLNGWWVSAIVAPVVAWLLWRRPPRARFAAYVFLSVLAARGLLIPSWPLVLFALAVIGAGRCPPRGASGPGSRAVARCARMPP